MITWLGVLTVYGLAYGFETIPGPMWRLMVPFVLQDLWDTTFKGRAA